jgi:hypothetical protein
MAVLFESPFRKADPHGGKSAFFRGGLFLLFLWPLSAQASDLNGYYKNFFIVFNLPDFQSAEEQPPIGAVNSRVRLKLLYNTGSRLSFNFAYDFSPRIQDPLLFQNLPFATRIDALAYRAFDFDRRMYPDENASVSSFGIFHNLDRANVAISTAPADIIIGRQAIAWGSARAVNPTDVIAPFSFEELDTEDRVGVDAVRVRMPLGSLSELDAGVVFGDDFQSDRSAYFVRTKLYVATTDVSLLLLSFRENLLAGVDIARSIRGAGFWFEAAYVWANAFDNFSSRNSYFRSSIGVDYSLSSKTYGFIEYHFNEAGSTKPRDYLTNLSRPAFTDGAVYLFGQHYLAPGVSYQVTPLVMFNGLTLFNVTDPSVFLAPQVEYNISQNIYLSAGAYVGLGKGLSLGGLTPEFGSEFGGYPDFFYTAFRVYF